MRAAEKCASVSAGGDGGLLRLRWPSGLREAVETAGHSPVGGGTSRSRVSVPAARSRRRRRRRHRGIRYSLVLPRPVGGLLRRRRRAGGGGASLVNPLYRSQCPDLRRLLQAAGVSAFCFKGAEQDVGLVEVRRVDQARASLGGGVRRRRAVVQERRSSGRVPGCWAFGDAFISSMWMSVYCDYSRSLAALGFLTIRARRSSGDGVRWRLPAAAGGFSWRTGGVDGPRDLVVFLLFVRGLSAKILLYVSFFQMYLYLYGLCILNINTGMS